MGVVEVVGSVVMTVVLVVFIVILSFVVVGDVILDDDGCIILNTFCVPHFVVVDCVVSSDGVNVDGETLVLSVTGPSDVLVISPVERSDVLGKSVVIKFVVVKSVVVKSVVVKSIVAETIVVFVVIVLLWFLFSSLTVILPFVLVHATVRTDILSIFAKIKYLTVIEMIPDKENECNIYNKFL